MRSMLNRDCQMLAVSRGSSHWDWYSIGSCNDEKKGINIRETIDDILRTHLLYPHLNTPKFPYTLWSAFLRTSI
jgi:hypothetical protein